MINRRNLIVLFTIHFSIFSGIALAQTSKKEIFKDIYRTGSNYFAYPGPSARQLTKTPEDKWDDYLEWLEDFEYGKLGIPKPDAVIYLDMPVDVSQKLMSSRYGGDESKKDIHEKNTDYLARCRVAADYSCKKLGWIKISCAENGELLTPEEISGRVYAAIADLL